MPRRLRLEASVLIPCLAASVLLLMGAPRSGAAQGKGQPPTITVSISFDPSSGVIGVSQDPVRVQRPGTRVQWTSDWDSWEVVVVRGNRAFGGSNDNDRSFMGGSGQRVGAVVPPAAAQGTFKYIVYVNYRGQRYELDPEIIIAF